MKTFTQQFIRPVLFSGVLFKQRQKHNRICSAFSSKPFIFYGEGVICKWYDPTPAYQFQSHKTTPKNCFCDGTPLCKISYMYTRYFNTSLSQNFARCPFFFEFFWQPPLKRHFYWHPPSPSPLPPPIPPALPIP